MNNYSRKAASFAFLALTFSLIQGCLDPDRILSCEFSQVTRLTPKNDRLSSILKSITLYDGLETKAHFDVVWMSDEAQALYVNLHAEKQGLSGVKARALLQQRLEENEQTITMYVLASVVDDSHISLSDHNSSWSLSLETASGLRIRPDSISEEDIQPEIRFLFGHRFARFKKMYKVVFPATTLTREPFFAPGDKLTLVCAGAGMYGTEAWIVPAAQPAEKLASLFALKEEQKGMLFSFLHDGHETDTFADDLYF
jgi:hypothetical protein